MHWTLREARVEDVDAVAEVWHEAWHAGHGAHVPRRLLPYRTRAQFATRLPALLASTTVAVVDDAVMGFVRTDEDELELLFVAAGARGTGIARALLRHDELAIAQRFAAAWLQVTNENARARRFYEREGWHDVAALPYEAETPDGRIPIASRRYERSLLR